MTVAELTDRWGLPRLRRVKRSHLAVNSGYLMLTTVVNAGLGFLFWTVAARRYPAAGVGLATAILAAVNMASILANLGLGPTIIQKLPTASDDDHWSQILNAGIFGSLACGLAIGAVCLGIFPLVSSRFSSVTSTPALAATIVMGTGFFSLSNILDYVFIAERRADGVLSRNAAFGCLKIALLFVPASLVGSSVVVIVCSWVMSYAAVSLITVRVLIPGLGRHHRWGVRHVPTELRRLASHLAKNHLITLSGAAIPYLMPIAVVATLSTVQNAYFYLAWLVASILMSVSPSVAGALLAETSRRREDLVRQSRVGMWLSTAIILPGCGLLVVLGRFLLGAFGAEYSHHSYGVLLLFCLVVWPDGVTNIYTTVLRVRGQEGLGAVLNILMAVVALASALLLLHPLGIAGAAWGWLIGEIAGTLFVVSHFLLLRQRGAVPLAVILPHPRGRHFRLHSRSTPHHDEIRLPEVLRASPRSLDVSSHA